MRETPFTISTRYRQPDLKDIESLLDTNLFRSARNPWQNLSGGRNSSYDPNIRAINLRALRFEEDQESILLRECDAALVHVDLTRDNVRARTAVLSWRWDITSEDITEEEYFNQSSRHILIGLRKAKSISPRELDFLIVDALTLNQFGEINATVLNDFVVLYSQIRVITTFYIAALPVSERYTPPTCPSYEVRGWCLYEASLYLMNEHVCLDELIYINPALVAEVEGDTNGDPNRKQTFYAVCVHLFMATVIHPFSCWMGDVHSDYYEALVMRYSGENETTICSLLRRPVDRLPSCIYSAETHSEFTIQRRMGYLFKLCDSLTSPEKQIVRYEDDLIKISGGQYYSDAMCSVILRLGDLCGIYKKHLYFVALHLLASRQLKYYLHNNIPFDFLSELSDLFDHAGVLSMKEGSKKIYVLANDVKWTLQKDWARGRIEFVDKIYGRIESPISTENPPDSVISHDGDIVGRYISEDRIVSLLVDITAAARHLKIPRGGDPDTNPTLLSNFRHRFLQKFKT
jgi:hypothetical protein